MTEKTPLVLPTAGHYRHFKGRSYQVIDVARHCDTEELLVVYRALYGDRKLWVRPAAHFSERVEVDGASVPRFQRVIDAEP